MMWWLVVPGVVVVALVGVVIHDLVQREHAILRNFPVIGHLRFTIEAFGPELRQYIVTSNDDERPFNRNQRQWVYATAHRTNNYFGFGTDVNFEAVASHMVIKQSSFPLNNPHPGATVRLPCAKVLGAARQRPRAVRPASVVNISGMSFGALSGPAIEALNRGAALAGCWHNTGEGSVSPGHQHGGELVFQVGTSYFGCRDSAGRFDLARLVDVTATNPVTAIEIKLSQGAKPGLGGLLPAAKVTPAIAAIRGIEVGVDCASPAAHSEFSDVSGLLDFVERIADATGLPVGIKSAVGDTDFFVELAERMQGLERGVDFITIDGGEGGTGAGPLVFTDHVALPFQVAFSRVFAIFAAAGLSDDIVFIGSAKLGLPDTALLAFALGCDMVNVGREAMLSLGCVQAQRCHTGRCPTGVATQSPWLARGLDPAEKSVRVASYIEGLHAELGALSRACGVPHPAMVGLDHIELYDGGPTARSAIGAFGYQPGWGRPGTTHLAGLTDALAGHDLMFGSAFTPGFTQS
jgi:glutamate synthase domain-containing protein 2